jgi:regulator of protease activity HflC (stomatin/prohibitin superfamily)
MAEETVQAPSPIAPDGQFRERPFSPLSGWLLLPVTLGLAALAIGAVVLAVRRDQPSVALIALPAGVLFFLSLVGYFVVGPNDSRTLVLFGHYRGTVRRIGLHWTNPFTSKKRVSLRVRTFETGSQLSAALKDATGKVLQEGTRSRHPLKVNDLDGNPIEIAAVVAWRVVDTAEALFAVDEYERYVEIQGEAALRNLASHYHYDSPEPGAVSLRGNTDLVGQRLKEELDGRLRGAGVEVLESRISSLSYAPEIAAAMLQRQQAAAVVAARQKIVEGAVGMVELAMEQIHAKRLADFSPEQKAQMVTNLLVVLVSERGAQPVVSTGHGQ